MRRIAAEGHTIGHRTWSHRSLMRIPPARPAMKSTVAFQRLKLVLHGVATTVPSTPFFRFPGFDSTQAILDALQSRGIVVFGADFWASDWDPMSPAQELKLLIDRLKAAGRGIILLHDTKTRTAAMLPAFLRHLRENRYRVVHVVPSEPVARVNVVPREEQGSELK